MYEDFYGLREKPFNLTPDPRFLYLSTKHKEAFAHLLFGIRNRSGFVMISGEIGTGKTTICRSLLGQLDSNTEVAFIFNPFLSPEELLRKVNEDFGIDTQADSVKTLVDELNDYLLDRTSAGKNCVLVIDEAQNLNTQTLEQIRLLSNLETETQKLLQIVLIGQPELAEKLELPELRQLNQRITARYHLRELDYDETIQYVAFRIRVAGGRKKVRFARSALRAIYNSSKGTPRVINSICDRALLIGYTQETHDITPAIIRQATGEIKGERIRRKKSFNLGRLAANSGFPIMAGLVLLLVILFTSGPLTIVRKPSREAEPLRQSPSSVEGLPSQRNLVDATTQEPLPYFDVAHSPPSSSNAPFVDMALGDESFRERIAHREQPKALEFEQGESGPVGMGRSPGQQTEAKERGDLVDSLDPAASRNQAFIALLRAWNMAVLSDLPEDDSLVSAARFAASVGLSIELLTPGFEQLVTINLPALVRLRSKNGELWVTLLGVEGDGVIITDGAGGTAAISRGQFEKRYTDRAVLLWLDPAPDEEWLRPQARGRRVRELQENLRTLGLLEAETSGFYGPETVETVLRLQRAAGLLIDGIAGPQVRMVLTAWLPHTLTPSLASQPFPSSIRSRILSAAAGVNPTPPARKTVARIVREEPPQPPAEVEPLPHGDAAPPEPPGIEVETTVPSREAIVENPEEAISAEQRILVEDLDEPEYRPMLVPPESKPEKTVTAPSSASAPVVPRDPVVQSDAFEEAREAP